MNVAPNAAIGAARLAAVPFAFTLDLDPYAVLCLAVVCVQIMRRAQETQRALQPSMRDVHGKRLLTTVERSEIRHITVQVNKLQQAFHKPGRLPQRQPQNGFHLQAGPDGSVAVDGLSSTFANRFRRPDQDLSQAL